ncbi:unnamed protein product [Auanema sp. JU1783]|nr:unnamed protein product [Auanema sp. JU1783]
MVSEGSSSPSQWKLRNFEILLALNQVFGFSMVILSGYLFNTMGFGLEWPSEERKGNPQNFHAFFMLLGLVYFQGEALLSYRLYRYDIKLLSKLVHVLFHILAIGFFVVGLIVAIQQKNIDGNKNFKSVHSWIGLAAMALYLAQFFFGFVNYLLPGVSLEVKQKFMPVHRTVGCVSFLLCCIQTLIGFTQYSIFADNSPVSNFGCSFSLKCNSKLDYIFNFSVISVVLYCITVLVLVAPPAWQRKKTADEMK